MGERRVPVLIVGGGPVGLALAVDLGWRGIACELVEQGDGSIASPKMNEVNMRSMEFCRRWGIAEQVSNCPFPADFPLDATFVTSLFGYELGRVERPARIHQAPATQSPYHLQACSQIWFDPILRATAAKFPTVTLRYRTRLDDFSEGLDGVSAELVNVDTEKRERVRADYLVGCDGAASLVRQKLGIALKGKGTIGHPINLFFRAPDLLARSGQKPSTFYLLVDHQGLWGNLRIIDPRNGVWRLMVDATDGSVSAEAVDRGHYLRRALGRAFDVEWIDVNIWRRRSMVAESYGRGRVLLAGDAVHQLSPTGALGMNSGLGDAVDLGWKFAAMFEGWGGPNLLASYDAERRPVGTRNVNMATGFYLNNEGFGGGGAGLEDDTPEGAQARKTLQEALTRDVGKEFRTVGLQIGYRYEDSPICVDDGTPPPPDDSQTYTPSARPGSRAPHCWLADGRTILDYYGKGFTLLRFKGAPDGDALISAARERDVPLTVVDIDQPEAAKLYERKLVLVRPDGHVAWRADTPPADPLALIDRVRGAS